MYANNETWTQIPIEREMQLPEQVRTDELKELTATTFKWMRVAKDENVDITDEVNRIIQTVQTAPDLNKESHTFSEVTFKQQYMLRGMYLTRIIRKITEKKIRQLAEIGRNDPRAQKKDLIPIINACEKWLLKELPNEWTLGSPNFAIHRYYWIMHKMEDMREKITSRL